MDYGGFNRAHINHSYHINDGEKKWIEMTSFNFYIPEYTRCEQLILPLTRGPPLKETWSTFSDVQSNQDSRIKFSTSSCGRSPKSWQKLSSVCGYLTLCENFLDVVLTKRYLAEKTLMTFSKRWENNFCLNDKARNRLMYDSVLAW